MFGKLTLEAIPFDQPIIMGAAAFMALIRAAVDLNTSDKKAGTKRAK